MKMCAAFARWALVGSWLLLLSAHPLYAATSYSLSLSGGSQYVEVAPSATFGLWKGFSERGICAESEMAYGESFDAARMPSAEAMKEGEARRSLGLTHHWIKHWNPKTGVSDGELLEIKRTLAAGWPVCGGFRWPSRAVWKEGVLQMCDANNVYDGHSVLLVGYQDEQAAQPGSGTGVFIFRDSDRLGGEGKMPYAYLQAYMNDALWIDGPRAANPTAAAARSRVGRQ